MTNGIPKGARVSRNMEHGGEILMPRGAEYRLISKQLRPDGKTDVTLEYILPKQVIPDDIPQIKKIAEQYVNSTNELNSKCFCNQIARGIFCRYHQPSIIYQVICTFQMHISGNVLYA